MEHKEIRFRIPWPSIRSGKFDFRRLLPSPGNVIFTLLMLVLLVLAQSAGALPLPVTQHAPRSTSASTIAYQGRLADSAGAPLTGTYNMIFRLYAANSGGTPLWEEQWTGPNGVKVSDGLFNVMLGSLTSIPQAVITGHDQLFLGITVGTDDEMAPRVQLGSVPFAVQALAVPDGSVTTAKIADGAVTQAKLAPGVLGIRMYSTSTTINSWQVPACNSVAATVPGLTLSVTTNVESTLDMSFAGLGRNTAANWATLSALWVDGNEILATSGPNPGGCRNGSQPMGWCQLASVASKDIAPGTHTIEVRIGCDGGEGYLFGGWLTVRVFPK